TGHADRARLLINLPVGHEEAALLRMRRAIREHQLQLQISVCRVPFTLNRVTSCIVEILLLAEREIDLDRIHRRDGGQRAAVGIVALVAWTVAFAASTPALAATIAAFAVSTPASAALTCALATRLAWTALSSSWSVMAFSLASGA